MRMLLLRIKKVFFTLPPRTRAGIVAVFFLGVGLGLLSYVSERHFGASPPLPPHRPIAVVESTPASLNARLQRAISQDLDGTARCQRVALVELGIARGADGVPDVSPNLIGMLRQATLAPTFYLHSSDTIFTADRLSPVVEHEMIHALDDQYSGRMTRATKAETTDERIALRAAIEGTALYMTNARPRQITMGPDIDRVALSLAYRWGPDYVAKNTTGRSLEQAFALEPETSYEVLFHVPPAAVSRLGEATLDGTDSDSEFLCSDRLGPAGVISAYFATHETPDPDEALRFAEAWVDDLLVRTHDEYGAHVTWMVRFRNQAWARRWLATVGLTLDSRSPFLTLSASSLESDDAERVPESEQVEELRGLLRDVLPGGH